MSRIRVEVAACIFIALFACSKSETSPTVDLIKTVASEARAKPRVEVSIKLGAEQPTPDDLALQKSIEDKIEEAHVGRLISSGTNAGFMTITVEVDNTADGIAKIRSVLQAAGVLNRSSFKVST